MKISVPIAALSIALAACGHDKADPAKTGGAIASEAGRGKPGAIADIKPLGDSGISGELGFYPADGGVRVEGYVRGLTPNSTHGFHIHEHPDCSAADGSSAGDHYNPSMASHGAPGPNSHLGDLGNITSDGEGRATVSAFIAGGTIGPSSNANGKGDVANHAVIVHAKTDDLATQPSGASGPKVACGVVSATVN
ncbi:MAG: superoxide dismutase family protein [Clostridia bacterium]|nr:superoxide dismutase family protein [Deltaproteobacteria bacterium]